MSNILENTLSPVKDEVSKYFPEVVGQRKPCRALIEHLKGYKQTSRCPHIMFVAPKGTGKTFIANAFGEHLTLNGSGEKKPFLEINCSTIKNVKHLMNWIMLPHVANNDITVFFDECSELPKDVEFALLSMLNPTDKNTYTFNHDEGAITIDFRRHTFIFATTEPQKVFVALMDRCTKVTLEEYSYAQLATILGRRLKGVTFGEGVIDEIASVLRGNAREAQKMSMLIKNYLASRNKKHFSSADWEQFSYSFGINPMGLDEMEMFVLQILAKRNKPATLTNLSAKTGLTKEALQRSVESYLQKNDLMEIQQGSGRVITEQGREFLKKLNETGGSR
jgi:Holliday junction resolvasome RuvABC ATP-dependent DNA helicase subunit